MPKGYAEEFKLDALAMYSELGLNETCRRMEISKSTLNGWVRKSGIPSPVKAGRSTQIPHNRITYHKERRLTLLDRLFEEVARTIEERTAVNPEDPDGRMTITPNDLQKLATATAILIDKRRLEEGLGAAGGEFGDPEKLIAEAQERAKALLGGATQALPPQSNRKKDTPADNAEDIVDAEIVPEDDKIQYGSPKAKQVKTTKPRPRKPVRV